MAASDRSTMLQEPVDLASYLFTRIKQCGIESVHGVPGDFNLVALDYIPKVGLRWVGNANELNASYAADAYARLRGMSCIVTTFGVGELSAINGIAGAYAERVPVVHVVGSPATRSQREGQILHHTLGNGNFRVFAQATAAFVCASENLMSVATAAEQIDYALTQCYLQARPVYIELPSDMPGQKIEGARLRQPLDMKMRSNDPVAETYATQVVLKYLREAKNAIILVDGCAARHHALKETHALIQRSNLPVFVTPMGKSAVDETLPNYGGVYVGDASHPDVREFVEKSDLVLYIGSLKSDYNTAEFTVRVSALNVIDFHSDYVAVKYSHYPGVRMHGVLRRVAESLDKPLVTDLKSLNIPKTEGPPSDGGPAVTHDWIWKRLSSWWQENDVVLTETGTSNFGIWDTHYAKGVTGLSQVLWGSIGWSVGATQGAALAAQELKRRCIAFIGDGSLQLGVQEIGTMLRRNLTPIIFIINNDGYTIERAIHGWEAEYNDIQPYRYTELPSAFGGRPEQYKTHQVRTRAELDQLLSNPDFNAAKTLQFVELFMGKKDLPLALTYTAELAAKMNSS